MVTKYINIFCKRCGSQIPDSSARGYAYDDSIACIACADTPPEAPHKHVCAAPAGYGYRDYDDLGDDIDANEYMEEARILKERGVYAWREYLGY